MSFSSGSDLTEVPHEDAVETKGGDSEAAASDAAAEKVAGDDAVDEATEAAEKKAEDAVEDQGVLEIDGVVKVWKEDAVTRQRRWATVFFIGPIGPCIASLVTMIVVAVTINPFEERPWAKDRKKRPCGEEDRLMLFLMNQLVLSYVFVFVYMMSIIGPCPCKTLKPLVAVYVLIAIWSIGAGLIGTIFVARGFECVRVAGEVEVSVCVDGVGGGGARVLGVAHALCAHEHFRGERKRGR